MYALIIYVASLQYHRAIFIAHTALAYIFRLTYSILKNIGIYFNILYSERNFYFNIYVDSCH